MLSGNVSGNQGIKQKPTPTLLMESRGKRVSVKFILTSKMMQYTLVIPSENDLLNPIENPIGFSKIL